MKKIIAIIAVSILAIAAWLFYDLRPRSAPPMASGSGAANGGGSGEVQAVAADPAQAAAAAATEELAALVNRSAATIPVTTKAEVVGKVVDATVASLRRGSREAWDPAAVVGMVGNDRGALFTWVRDRTALVPYRGSLRGAVGVVMDRVGNSLDRSLLLADLLSHAGHTVRLATAPLEAEAVARLTASLRARARPSVSAVPAEDGALLDTAAALIGGDPAALRSALAKADAADAEMIAKLRIRIAAQGTALASLVAKPADAPADDADAALAEHWWVQVKDGETWIDLDPALADAAPGKALAAAPAETLAVADLGDDRRHTLTVRVMGEVWRRQVREEAVLLEHTFAPSLFYGQRISVTSVPIDMPSRDKLLLEKRPALAARAALAEQTEWVALLRIDKAVVAKMSVTDGGETFDVTAADGNTTRLGRAVQRATREGMGGAADLLGGLPGSAKDEPEPLKTAAAESSGFTGQWIEYELRSPGSPPVTARRTVFDAYRGADRAGVKPVKLDRMARLERGLALTGETDLLPTFAAIPQAFVADRSATALAAARPVLIELADLAGKAPPDALLTRLAGLAPLPGSLYTLALARIAWSPVGGQVYLGRLGLLTETRRLVIAGNQVRWRDGFDIVANPVAVWPASSVAARATRLTQGVADTAAEAAVLACRGGTRCVRTVNTSDEFAAATQPWTVVRDGAAPELDRFSAPARTLARADLAAGYALVVPSSGATTWWRVDAASGESLGMGTLGGTATSEYALLLVDFIGSTVQCNTGSDSNAAWVACMASAGLGVVGAYAGIQSKVDKALIWATLVVGHLLGVASNVVIPADEPALPGS